MLKEYKSTFHKIKVPADLIEKTAQAAKAETRIRSCKLPAILISASAVACLILLFVRLTWTVPQPMILTSLEPGQHVQQVELSNGLLHFQNITEEFSLTLKPNLGVQDVRQEQWSIDQYIEHLGVDISLPYLPDGLYIEEQSATVFTSEDGKILSDAYYASYGSAENQILELHITKGKLPDKSISDQSDNSMINKNPLFMGIDEDFGRYYAQFINNGVGYYVAAENIEQEEFIKIIINIF